VTSIKPGDCFFNVKRFSCLRVKRVGDKWADAITWRPDGSKGSNIVKVRLDSLTKVPYWRMVATRVYTEHSSFEFEVGEKREYHDGTTGARG